MTLITLHSRIHFASHVLEEALRAETEAQRLDNALLLCPVSLRDGDFLARVEAGLADCGAVTRYIIAAGETKYDTAAAATAIDAAAPVDLIVSFGSADCIAHGRKARHAITARRYEAAKARDRGAAQQSECQPAFFVVPSVDGMPDPCLESGAGRTFKTTPPGVIICDPTVIGDADEASLAKALSLTMGRCLNVLGAASFNPLADGLAMDALGRIRMVADAGPEWRRDLMAATLMSAIALQKGTGLVEALRYSFGKVVDRDLDSAVLHRVMLARLLASNDGVPTTVVAQVLGLPSGAGLPAQLEGLMRDMPLPATLREMDVAWNEVEEAVDFMEPKFGTPQLRSHDELTGVLRDVF